MKISVSSIPPALRLVLPMAALLLGATGCYEENARVVVFPDGSGRIVVTRQFTPAAVRLIETQASMGGGMADSVRSEGMFFSEKQLKADAKRLFGKGVRFVSAQRVDQHGGRGSIALYAFDKIDGVVLQPHQLMQSAMSSVERGGGDSDEEETDVDPTDPFATAETGATEVTEEEGGAGDDPDVRTYARHSMSDGSAAYRFKFQAGAQPKLTVRVPAAIRAQTKNVKAAQEDAEEDDSSMGDMMMGGEEEIPDEARQQMMANGNPLQLTGNETSQEIQMKVYKGMRFSIDVEVRGAAATTTATHPDARQAGRCTLLRFDAGEIMKSSGAKGAQMVQKMLYGQLDHIFGKPGVTTENQPEVTFTIKPATPADRGGK